MFSKPFSAIVISGDFYEIGKSYEIALSRLGLTVYRKELQPWKYSSGLNIRLLRRCFSQTSWQAILKNNHARITRSVLKNVEILRPDLAVIYKGRYLSPDILAENKRKFPETHWICWVMDPILKYDEYEKSILEVMDAVFYYRRGDQAKIQNLTPNSYFLPAAYDDTYYMPKNSKTENFQISFIGALTPYRYQILENVIRCNGLLPQETCVRIGKWPGLALKQMIQPQAFASHLWKEKFIQAKTVDAQHINQIYNNSKVCLNIHREKIEDYGVNPRAFEISGAGGFQLIDQVPDVEDFFEPDREIVTYSSPQEAADKFAFYARNFKARSRIAHNAYIRACSQHRYIDRFQEMLNVLRYEELFSRKSQ